MLTTLLAVNGVFSLLGGGAAFAIVYMEYQRHKLGRGQVIGEALRAGMVAFVALLGLSVVVGLLVGRLTR
ncbi:MAG: hypothetical protein ABIL25_00715 [candidate division WOR-3 bacterium]